MIPAKYVFHGDRQEGESLRGQARRVVTVLDNMMRTGVMENQILRFSPYDGAVITAHKFFGQTVVDIYVGVPTPEVVEPEYKICPCNCNLSLGWVLEVQLETIDSAPLYTVMACNKDGNAYIPYKDILASDWTMYEVGQPVLLIPYNSMSYLCCTDKTGGENAIRGCSPLVSTESTSSDNWRTTYRILPWCAVGIPKKLDPSRWKTNG